MNKPTRALALAALVAALMTGCAGIASKEIEAERAALHAGSLELDAKGRPDASIAPSGAVTIGDDTLALTDAQRAETAGYRDAVLDLIDLTLDDTKSLTNRAMVTALLGVVTGLGDQAERHIESQAKEIAHTPEFCGLLDDVRQRQDRMIRSVAALQPYADVSEQNVKDCAAGRPYDLNIEQEYDIAKDPDNPRAVAWPGRERHRPGASRPVHIGR